MSTYQPKVYKKDGGNTLVVASGGKIVIEDGGTIQTESGVGAPAGTGVTASENVPTVHRTVLTLAALSIVMTDAGVAGSHGTQKIYDFPVGQIQIDGVVSDLAITAGVGGIANGAAVVGSIGSVAVGTDNATLTSTEANILPSIAATLTGGVGTCDGELAAPVVLDGTTTAVDAILNFAVPDADSSADDTLSVSGTVTITWTNLGDN